MDLSCNICKKTFSFNQNLKRHIRKFHPDTHCKEKSDGSPNTSSKFLCTLCRVSFSRGTGLRRHVNKFHPDEYNDLISSNEKEFKCNECNKSYAYLSNLKQHRRDSHKELSQAKKFFHKCVFCEFLDDKRHKIVEHYEEIHHITIEKEDFEFEGRIQFEDWKKEIEERTNTFFAKVCSASESGNEYKKLKYICNRSGYYKTKGKGLRKLRDQGSLKINGVCPAEIDVLICGRSKYIIHYIKSHCGHKNDYRDQYLTKDQKETIAVKIAADVPFRVILDEVRDSNTLNGNLERANRLSKKDLYNIAKCFNLGNDSRVPVDGLSVEDWVIEMSKKDSVIYYKLKGSFCNRSVELNKDDFVIIIMNQGQREILKNYASNCICVDRTHYLNNDKMELISLFVLDDENRGFPCAFLISNRIDTVTVSLLYSCIKEKIGTNLETRIFLSDIDNIFYSSWLKIMGIPKFRLFCPWHLEKVWRDNLQKISSRKLQSAVYQDLKRLQQEENPESFSSKLTEFIDNWLTEETLEFIFYFRENFYHNHKVWAQYYLVENGLDIGIDLETSHDEISKLFVFGKNNNRLNMAVTAVMNYVGGRLIEKISKMNIENDIDGCNDLPV